MVKVITIFVFLFITTNFAQEIKQIPHPIIGNQIYYFDKGYDVKEAYQLIRVKTKSDVEKVKTYIRKILRDRDLKVLGDASLFDLLTNFVFIDSSTAYVFVSSVDEEWIYNEPYIKNENIWFDVELKNLDDEPHFSIWIFHLPDEKKFRVRINVNGYGAEMGVGTLMNKRFKKGTKNSNTIEYFKIESFGEYFDEIISFYSKEGTNEKSVFGTKSYLDKIDAKKGTLFGFTYVYMNDVPKNYNFKIIHPEYLKGPEKGSRDVSIQKLCEPNKTDHFIWQFSEDYEMVPGEWILQINDGQNLLYEKKFIINF